MEEDEGAKSGERCSVGHRAAMTEAFCTTFNGKCSSHSLQHTVAKGVKAVFLSRFLDLASRAQGGPGRINQERCGGRSLGMTRKDVRRKY